ncbi:hypothetical protein Tco_0654105, partial [Tanacetum coccineum]
MIVGFTSVYKEKVRRCSSTLLEALYRVGEWGFDEFLP